MTYLLRLVACLFLCVSLNSFGALYDRGNGLIYDDVLNITWMQDANYAQTSGYAAANVAGSGNSGPVNIQADGRMGWSAAITWAEQLEYEGYDDWRLASAGSAPTSGYNITNGELGHMFYNNLGNTAEYPFNEYSSRNFSFTDATTGAGEKYFVNVANARYWLGEDEVPSHTGGAWLFATYDGYQGGATKNVSHNTWAVRAGDVSTVPVPAAAWLFGSALAGLLVTRRKK